MEGVLHKLRDTKNLCERDQTSGGTFKQMRLGYGDGEGGVVARARGAPAAHRKHLTLTAQLSKKRNRGFHG